MKEKKQQQSKSPEKKKEKLSTKDIKDLMGMNRDTYVRHNGAIRKK